MSTFKEKYLVYTLSGISVVAFFFLINNLAQISIGFKAILGVLAPFVWGIGFSYVLWLTAAAMERSILRKLSPKPRRVISSFLSLLLMLVIVALFFVILIPSIIESIASITETIRNNSKQISEFFEFLADKLTLNDDIYAYISTIFNNAVDSIANFAKEQIPMLMNSAVSSVRWAMNLIISVIVALYILLDRDHLLAQIKNISRAFLKDDQYEYLRHVALLTHDKIGNFIVGKLWDSLIIGVICFIVMSIMGMDYVLLISFVIGITNIIPFFGPFIGAIPSAFILLICNPWEALEFIIFIIILQQVDGNIIGPHILGDSVGLPSLWILFAIIVGGAYFGVMGMILGVPLFAVFYFLFKEYVYSLLKKKGIQPIQNKNKEVL